MVLHLTTPIVACHNVEPISCLDQDQMHRVSTYQNLNQWVIQPKVNNDLSTGIVYDLEEVILVVQDDCYCTEPNHWNKITFVINECLY